MTMCRMSRKIGEIAANTNIPRLQGSVDVMTAIDVMDLYKTDIVAVECEDSFAGIFTRGDLNRTVIRQNLDPRQTILYEAMTLNPPHVTADMTVKETYDSMIAYQWEYMPVLIGTRLCGIVSMRELGKHVLRSYEEAQEENKMILNYIQSGESYAISNYNH